MIDFEQWYEQEGYGLASGSDENSDCYFGARESWNYQQAKIDAIVNLINKHQYSNGERILKEVKEFLK